MSAYVLNDKTTAAIVSFAAVNNLIEQGTTPLEKLKQLVNDNVLSVCTRYTQEEYIEPEVNDYHLIENLTVMYTPLAIWYKCRAYVYQTCELVNYKENPSIIFAEMVASACEKAMHYKTYDERSAAVDRAGYEWGE